MNAELLQSHSSENQIESSHWGGQSPSAYNGLKRLFNSLLLKKGGKQSKNYVVKKETTQYDFMTLDRIGGRYSSFWLWCMDCTNPSFVHWLRGYPWSREKQCAGWGESDGRACRSECVQKTLRRCKNIALITKCPVPVVFELDPLCCDVFYGILNILMIDSHISYRSFQKKKALVA